MGEDPSSDDATINASAPYVSVAPCVPAAADGTNCDAAVAPAKQAGITNGDEITAVNGTAVHDYGDLVAAVRGATQSSATVTFVHDGQTRTTKSSAGAGQARTR